jgi:hypothetical protein
LKKKRSREHDTNLHGRLQPGSREQPPVQRPPESPPRNPERPRPRVFAVLMGCLVIWIGVLIWLAIRTNQ